MFRDVAEEKILLVSEKKQAEFKRLLSSLKNEEQFKYWIDSSAKNALPPDFYNDNEKLMLEVMRVDDHGFKKKGNIINPTLQKEHQLFNELRKTGILDSFPNLENVFVNADSGLPTDEDHNFKFYYDNFARTINNHKNKIDNYRKNHPNYKLVFFVFDESTAYIECKKRPNKIWKYKMISGQPHLWFFDEKFVNAFIDSDIDYLIWYTPYKGFEHSEPNIELP